MLDAQFSRPTFHRLNPESQASVVVTQAKIQGPRADDRRQENERQQIPSRPKSRPLAPFGSRVRDRVDINPEFHVALIHRPRAPEIDLELLTQPLGEGL
jgi:hypothetical protein